MVIGAATVIGASIVVCAVCADSLPVWFISDLLGIQIGIAWMMMLIHDLTGKHR